MLKKIWDKGLFVEGIRQTYIITFFAVLISILLMLMVDPSDFLIPRSAIEFL